MREHHVIDLAPAGIHALDIARNPFAGQAAVVGKTRNGPFAEGEGVQLTAVQQHRGAVGEDQEKGFGGAGIDEVDLELACLPGGEHLPGARVFLAQFEKGAAGVEGAGSTRGRRYPEKIASVHGEKLAWVSTNIAFFTYICPI